MTKRVYRSLGVLAGALVFALALWSLHDELSTLHYHDIRLALRAVPNAQLLAGLGFTALGYAALVSYDWLALHYIQRPLAPRRVAFVGFVAYALSQSLGFHILLGGSLRYRFYSAWGLSSADIALAVGFNSLTFWLGVLTIGGAVFLIEPQATPDLLDLPVASLATIGALLLVLVVGYLVASAVRRAPLRALGWEFNLPRPPLAVAQVVASSVDWVAAGAVLFALLPADHPVPFGAFLSAFLLAQVVGLISHVPGGIGIFESVIVFLMKDEIPAAGLVGALLAYRVVYYLIPLGTALALLAAHEVSRARHGIARAAAVAGRWVPGVVPSMLAFTTFISGIILLLSGATPSVQSRLHVLADVLPLAVIELSHFTASVVGAALLVLAWGLRRRLDAAWWLTSIALLVGIAASLLKGVDFEEATFLALVFTALVPARRHFYRRASMTSDVFSPGWGAAIVLAVGSTFWLGLFAFKHVDYSHDLWWEFAVRGDAPRFLRASVGIVALLLFVALQRLLRPALPRLSTPGEPTLDRVATIVHASRDVQANLALLGDKSLLFSDAGNAFVMYGVSGRSFVALGDPVGAPSERQELGWRFRELADRHGAATVFYEVRMHNLPLYLDLGLSLLKLGEEARVPLGEFSLQGGARKGMRRVVNQVEKDGGEFGIVQVEDVPSLMPELRAVSDEWLESKRVREKAFSLGCFSEPYLRRFPLAVVRREGRVVAFANLMRGQPGDEITVDLMRYSAQAPENVMEYLFIQTMLYGRAEEFGHFNLGMAPLAGLENRALAPLWNRVGALVYRFGENFYNFQGLREYKEKFDPIWEPRYLASPGGLMLPRILANVAALISGGLTGIVKK
ncbi:MAG: bifunctional lysylphosphatidylglycerol flippase/synthetase MprF [Gemmatimonadetes bacterium]|nr:bifunctional lysylphosphatidylglycerol flippase/synthetase MprF [Gemmatimonadota bacterium]